MRRWIPILTIAAIAGMSAPSCAGPVSDRIYPAPQTPLTLEGKRPSTKMVAVTTSDGVALQGFYVAPSSVDRPLLLVFHGNATSANKIINWMGPQIDAGFGVLAAEYRGYSGLPGKPSASGLAQDARAFYDLAVKLAAGRKVWVVGHSLGAGVSFGLAHERKLDQLVTIGAFTSLRDMTSGLARALVPDDYRNLDRVSSLDEPLAIVHGARDQVVPAKMGNVLHNAAAAAKLKGRSYLLLDADHWPTGQTLLPVFEDILSRNQAVEAPALPTTVKVFDF